MAKVDLLVKNGEVWTPGGFVDADIAVSDGKVRRSVSRRFCRIARTP